MVSIRLSQAEDFQLQEAKLFRDWEKKQVVQDIGGSKPDFMPACCMVWGDGITVASVSLPYDGYLSFSNAEWPGSARKVPISFISISLEDWH